MPKPKPGSRSLVPERFSRDRKRILEFIRRGQGLAEGLGAPALLGEIEQLAASAAKPFLFVVVGEVKSGKSSLINALLEAPVCAVDSAPCTDRVQEINYGEEEQRIEVSQHEERLHLPHSILRHIAIVDTSGTNSIDSRHQQVTDSYLPQRDSTTLTPGFFNFVSHEIDPTTDSIAVRGIFENPKNHELGDFDLIPGQYVPVRFTVGETPDALVIPQTAVVETQAGPHVYVVGADNKAELRPLELGRPHGAKIIVNKGLKHGERVVAVGVQKVRSGVEVKPVATAGPGEDTAAPSGQTN